MGPAVLILAGRRADAPDPLARAAGVSHKCLVPVNGIAMLARVIRTVRLAYPGSRLFVSLDDFGAATGEPAIARYGGEGVTFVKARPLLVESIISATSLTGFPLIVTTADNVLLTPGALQTLTDESRTGSADALVVLTEKRNVLAAHPDGQRRFYRFRDGDYSNCNLFWLRSETALKAAESFRGGGQFAKHPVRFVKAFGLMNLVRFRFRLATLAEMFGRISRRFGLDIRPMLVTDGRLAIDVDNERTLRIAEEILARR